MTTFFDVLVWVTCAIWLALWIVWRRPSVADPSKSATLGYAGAGVCIGWLLHLTLAGWRWQMLPAYLVCVLILLATVWRLRSRSNEARRLPGWWMGILTALGSLALLASMLASYAFPVFGLPPLSGQYAVGLQTLELEDSQRLEPYAPDSGHPRRLTLSLWYPAVDHAKEQFAPYWDDAWLRSSAVTAGTPLPSFTFSHLERVKTQARRGAVFADGRFPVIIYSHGVGIGWAGSNLLIADSV